jgi:hypothetical protein
VSVKVALPVPIRLLIANRRTSSASLPRLPTGDGSFDSTVRLFGVPNDVLRSAFDAEACADVWASTSHRLASLRVVAQDGVLTHTTGLPGPPHSVHAAIGGDVGAFRAQVAFVLRLAERLRGAYERVRLDVRTRGGPGAEAAWLASVQAAYGIAASKQRRFRALVNLSPLVVIVLAVALAIAWSYC